MHGKACGRGFVAAAIGAASRQRPGERPACSPGPRRESSAEDSTAPRRPATSARERMPPSTPQERIVLDTALLSSTPPRLTPERWSREVGVAPYRRADRVALWRKRSDSSAAANRLVRCAATLAEIRQRSGGGRACCAGDPRLDVSRDPRSLSFCRPGPRQSRPALRYCLVVLAVGEPRPGQGVTVRGALHALRQSQVPALLPGGRARVCARASWPPSVAAGPAGGRRAPRSSRPGYRDGNRAGSASTSASTASAAAPSASSRSLTVSMVSRSLWW